MKLLKLERYEQYSAPTTGLTALDHWWLRQFARLVKAEREGMSPQMLAPRWLVLDLLALTKRRRWQVSFIVPEFVAHILDDADIRAKDARYGEGQLKAAEGWLHGWR